MRKRVQAVVVEELSSGIRLPDFECADCWRNVYQTRPEARGGRPVLRMEPVRTVRKGKIAVAETTRRT